MEQENHTSPPADSVEKPADQPETQNIPVEEDAHASAAPDAVEEPTAPAVDTEKPATTAASGTAESDHTKDEALDQDEPQPSAEDPHDEDSHISLSGEPEFDSHEDSSIQEEATQEQHAEAEHTAKEKDEPSLPAEDSILESEPDQSHLASELGDASGDAETQDGTEASSRRGSDSCDLDRRHSVRTEALIQAAARAVVSMREQNGEEDQDSADESAMSSTNDTEDQDDTIHAGFDQDTTSRPQSSASRSIHSSEGDCAENSSRNSTEDDVFSDRSPRTSIHSSDEHYDNDSVEAMTEKGDQSPYVRSRVASGVSTSDASVMSEQSRLSRYDKEDFVPTSRTNRPAFRSPSSVRAMQMSSPTPSVYSSPARSKKQYGLPTISRLGSPTVSGQFPPKGRSTPTRFKRPEPAPLVLLHVTLLPLRWAYGEVVNYFESKKVPPALFSSEGIKNLRVAWRQLQDRLGDTEMERGILLPHPQNDYEILEERLLEALELPLRRRARILECGHYLGPSNEMTPSSDIDDDSEDTSDAEDSEASSKKEKRHWCKTCKGEIKYEELGSERVFRIKVYASNGLMSPGAWEACWKEMERVDIEVEPITGSLIQGELAKLGVTFDQEHQQRLDQQAEEQERLHLEEEERLRMEMESRQQLEEERAQLEAQRQQFEEERRRSLEESQKKLEEERRQAEKEQRERIEEERRQQFEEERQLLDDQRREFEVQRQELDEQRKMIEQEQRQHLEEARRQELEEEHRLLDEQRQQLEEARQQFETERRQRLEEEELRRQREEEEQKQLSSARSISRSSFVEDDLASPTLETASSTDVDGRRRDSERLREIYGSHGRSSSEITATNSSPAIHIHVGSGRQQEEEQNSRQLATIPAPRETEMQPAQAPADTRQSNAYVPPQTPAPTSEQSYQRREDRRRSLDTASLAELVGESIRILLQDPKNVAIAVLVVLIAMLAGQYAKRDEHGVELYKPQQHHSYQHHQLDAREPVGQVIMNTPAMQRVETMAPPPVAETIYKTVTESPSSSPTPLVETVYKTIVESSQAPPPSQRTETVYHTVVQQPPPVQEKPTPIVETIYTTVTESLAQPHHQTIVAHEYARESTPSSADPSTVLSPLSSASAGESGTYASPPSPASEIESVAASPSSTAERDIEPELQSNEDILKAIISEEAEVDTEVDQITTTVFNPTCGLEQEAIVSEPDSIPAEEALEKDEHEQQENTIVDLHTSVEPVSVQSSSFASSSTDDATISETTTVRTAETITETVVVTATRTSYQPELSATGVSEASAVDAAA